MLSLYRVWLFALDVILVMGGACVVVAFLLLASRASGLDARRMVASCLLGASLAGFAAVSGCGCRRIDHAFEAALRVARGPVQEEERAPPRLAARPAAMPTRTPWPPSAPPAKLVR